jgi:DNA-binding transcriptional regulator of glucitol operon
MDRRFLRPGWVAGHLLVFLAFLTCLRLGWWQWDRTHDADGTAQNLGYALLWPAFGVAFIYMWVKFMRLELLKDLEDDEQTELDLRAMLDEGQPAQVAPDRPGESVDLDSTGEPAVFAAGDGETAIEPEDADAETPARGSRRDQQRPSQAVTISVATVQDDDDDDPELTAYNQALAALAEEDRRRAR